MGKLIFICGEICSGKTTEMYNYSNANAKHIEVSSIVKNILETNERDQLQGHPELSTQIIAAIEYAAKTWEFNIITGVRQKEILEAFPNAELVWLNVDEETRFQRYLKRGDIAKDKLTLEGFQLAQKRDNELGLQKVKEYINTINEQLHNTAK